MSIYDLNINTDVAKVPSGPSRPGLGRSYIMRHWRGELSLTVSYWVNALLGGFATFLVLLCVELLAAPDSKPLIFALGISAAWLFAAATDVWHLIGTWRSARKHKSRGGRRFWAGTARVMVVLGLLGLANTVATETIPQIVEYWLIALGDPTIPEHELQILHGGTELEYAGGITFGATDDVRVLLDADPEIRVIHLNSPGGRVGEARKLRNLIRERNLVTYTASECASACTIAFMGGVERFVAPEAKLGFHRADFPGLTRKELARLNAEEWQRLVAEGVAVWFATHAYSTPSDSMWWPTSDELERAGVISGAAVSTASRCRA
jgi:hypothetical protein